MQSLAKQESFLPVPADNRSQAARRPQFGDAWQDIAKLEADLWSAADNLRANSKLTSSDYFMPVLGVIFLRHAQNRSYLNDTGRAGFVMSSQASSAGHAERDVRRRIVQSGAVDAMLAVRSGFFYTRSVPCELWFFDRAKPKARADSVLMLDARNVFRQVTRKINDFSPEQLSNLTAIVWLHRGQTDRFLGLVSAYLERLYAEADEVPMALDDFDLGVDALRKPCAEPRRRTPTENSAPRTKRPCARPWRRLTRPTAPTSPRAMPCSRCCNTKAAPRQRSRTTTPDSMPLARSSTPRPRP